MPPTEDLTIADKAILMILDAEGFTGRVDYPGGASGPTGGHGYDFAYHSAAEIKADWKGLPPAVLARLVRCVGQTGEKAKALVAEMKDIKIPRELADKVFRDVDVPRWIKRTAEAFPGYEQLADEVQGALVSLVFNRGAGMGAIGKPSWDARREMRQIRRLVASYRTAKDQGEVLRQIAGEIRSMKRLWEGKGLDGLITRREAEAQLVESVIG